jgi:hypothetical protein
MGVAHRSHMVPDRSPVLKLPEVTRSSRNIGIRSCDYYFRAKAISNKYSVEITNKMQPCIRIYYSTIHWRLNMFRAVYRSSWALIVFAASGLHTHVVTGRSPHANINHSYFYWIILRSTDPWILNKKIILPWKCISSVPLRNLFTKRPSFKTWPLPQQC